MKKHRIAAVFDTETTNVRTGDGWSAFACLYIMNDLRGVDLRSYEPGCDGERIVFARDEGGFHEFIRDLVEWGKATGVIPIVCAYNLMFDLQTVRCQLNRDYGIKTTAQTATNIYTADLMEGKGTVLRFWDTFHLEMNGLAAMGRTCGIAKLAGEWDYSLVRTPETPLTEQELGYAARDVQVIPAYLRYLLEAHEWLEPEMLGCQVLTKTSLVRQMARDQVGKLRFRNSRGKKVTLQWAFERTCAQEMPWGYYDYALRTACFRGGFTFTSARFASIELHRVASLDVVSMHHAFICGRRVPVHFERKSVDSLRAMSESVVMRSFDDVLARYDQPFLCAFHMRVRFRGLKLREGSAFAAWHIGLLSEGKFRASADPGFSVNEGSRIADAMNRASGWVDWASGPVFAFGKLMSADEAVVHVNELELWCMSRVYEWESMEPILGEGTLKYARPPDYVTLQSCLLFEQKSAAKAISASYEEGAPYAGMIAQTIPPGIAEQLRQGTMSADFFASWYNSTVKGMFNGIYGTQAQNIYKADYRVRRGEWEVDRDSVVTHSNWEEKRKTECKVFYNYGMRIVGGSRLHLVCAIEGLYGSFGDSIGITGGDTDSLKIALGDVEPADVMEALAPLHEAVTRAIDATMEKPRRDYPALASSLDGVGTFELEGIADDHYEAWNKARVSRKNGRCRVTCAGLSRPEGAYTIEDWLDDRSAQVGFHRACEEAIGYDSVITHDVCHALQRTHPSADARFEGAVTDHLGNRCEVDAHEAIALYAADREMGGTEKRANRENVEYMRSRFGREVECELREVAVEDGEAVCKPLL